MPAFVAGKLREMDPALETDPGCWRYHRLGNRGAFDWKNLLPACRKCNGAKGNGIPLDIRILKEMRRSSLGLDLYMWISYKSFALTPSATALLGRPR